MPLQFTLISQLSDGRIQLGVMGDAGFNFQIATSTNLVSWNVLTNLPNPSGSLQFTDAPVSGVNLFYRAQYP